jgi:hypothetical protein
MDQRSIVVLLHLKELSDKDKDVHTELVQILASHAIAYSAMTKYIGNDVILQNEPEAEDQAEDKDFSITDDATMEALEMMQFAPVHQIAKMTFILPPTGFRRLTKLLHFVLKRWR